MLRQRPLWQRLRERQEGQANCTSFDFRRLIVACVEQHSRLSALDPIRQELLQPPSEAIYLCFLVLHPPVPFPTLQRHPREAAKRP